MMDDNHNPGDGNPQQIEDIDREAVWHAFTQMADYQPFIIELADGCELIDTDGNRYLDAVSSLWCNVHGHNHPAMNAAIVEQLQRVSHVTSLGMSNPTTVKLAARLVQLAPEGLEHVFFSGDGASSVEVALKMAFQYWRQCDDPQPEKNLFIALDRAYHGDTLGSVSVGGVARFHQMFKPLLFETIQMPIPDRDHLPEGVPSEDACQHYLADLEKVLEEHHHQTAAVIMEPLVQGAAGMIMHPDGYLAGVRKLTRTYNVLMIADEVAVGFGRTGTMFACQQEEVAPDLLCLAKGLTGGYLAMAATLASGEIFNAFLGDPSRTFFHGHTYGGNPLAAAAALANLDIFEQEQTLQRLPATIHHLQHCLQHLGNHPLVANVRQRGMIAAVELVQETLDGHSLPDQGRAGAIVCQHARQLGAWLRPLGDILVIMPPLSVSREQVSRIVDALEAGIDQLASQLQQAQCQEN
ncbi:MAG: adenosylmethionine--8-amino-7-oxononanoate transaminase [Pirellulaceae bacterium]